MKTPKRPLHGYVAEVSEHTEVRAGVPLPMRTHEYGGGVNFAFFSRHASRVRLEFFDLPEDATPARVIDLDPAHNRTGNMWHVWVEGIRPGQLYAYRVDGPYQPREGYRFNFHKLLLDPFATAISWVSSWDFKPARGYDPSAPDRDLVCSSVDDAGAMPRRPSFMKHTFVASRSIRALAWRIPARTGANGKDPLSQRTGGGGRGIDAREGVQ